MGSRFEQAICNGTLNWESHYIRTNEGRRHLPHGTSHQRRVTSVGTVRPGGVWGKENKESKYRNKSKSTRQQGIEFPGQKRNTRRKLER